MVTAPDIKPVAPRQEHPKVSDPWSPAEAPSVHDAHSNPPFGTFTAQPRVSNEGQNEAAAPAAEGTSTQPAVEPVNESIPAAAHPLWSSDMPHWIGQDAQMVATNVNYNLFMIDGYPYLLRGSDRRSSRRHRSPLHASSGGQAGVPNAPAGSMDNGQATDSPVRHHHVDLPATAAIAVRTAEGQRALVLSPEGVRTLAAQGVNVSRTVTRRNTYFGISSEQFRSFMRTGIPHSWLFLKLAFFVALLGSNSSWSRILLLSAVATFIFSWQSGLLASFLTGSRNQAQAVQPQGQNGHGNTVTPPPVPQGAASQSAASGSASESATTNTGVRDAEDLRPAGHAVLHNLGRAFFSSILPGIAQPTTPVVQQAGFAPATPLVEQNEGESTPRRRQSTSEPASDVLSAGESGSDAAVAPEQNLSE